MVYIYIYIYIYLFIYLFIYDYDDDDDEDDDGDDDGGGGDDDDDDDDLLSSHFKMALTTNLPLSSQHWCVSQNKRPPLKRPFVTLWSFIRNLKLIFELVSAQLSIGTSELSRRMSVTALPLILPL